MSVIVKQLYQKKGNSENKIRERLAEIYFPSRHKKAGISENSSKTGATSHISKLKRNAAVLVAAMLFFAVLLFIFSAYAININIVINKEARSSYKNLFNAQNISFFGAATDKSGLTDGYITLINDGAKRRAAVAIDLKEPIDLLNRYLLISLMSKRGDAALKVIFRDKNYRSYISDILHIQGAKKDWQSFIISAKTFKESIDIRNIQHIRLESEHTTIQDKEVLEFIIKKVVLLDS